MLALGAYSGFETSFLTYLGSWMSFLREQHPLEFVSHVVDTAPLSFFRLPRKEVRDERGHAGEERGMYQDWLLGRPDEHGDEAGV